MWRYVFLVLATSFALTMLSYTGTGQVSLGGQQNQGQLRFAPDDPALPSEPVLMIGPVNGWTTKWHPAPALTSIQAGVVLEFKAMQALDHTFLGWNGATELSTNFYETTAICPMFSEGSFAVEAVFRTSSGIDVVKSCSLDVVLAEPVSVLPITAWVDPVALGPDPTNQETYVYYSSGESIADIVLLGANTYATSINRTVHFDAAIDPPGFTPLLEWRVDGDVKELGGTLSHSFKGPAEPHAITVGPLESAQAVIVDVYTVTITSHISNHDIIPEGQPITFTAVTDPPGYENGIRWLASTLYGSSDPVQGTGSSFTVQFDETWGTPAGEDFQWLGVKSDDTIFNQDQKMTMMCYYDVLGTVSSDDCDLIEQAFCFALNISMVCGEDTSCSGLLDCLPVLQHPVQLSPTCTCTLSLAIEQCGCPAATGISLSGPGLDEALGELSSMTGLSVGEIKTELEGLLHQL